MFSDRERDDAGLSVSQTPVCQGLQSTLKQGPHRRGSAPGGHWLCLGTAAVVTTGRTGGSQGGCSTLQCPGRPHRESSGPEVSNNKGERPAVKMKELELLDGSISQMRKWSLSTQLLLGGAGLAKSWGRGEREREHLQQN